MRRLLRPVREETELFPIFGGCYARTLDLGMPYTLGTRQTPTRPTFTSGEVCHPFSDTQGPLCDLPGPSPTPTTPLATLATLDHHPLALLASSPSDGIPAMPQLFQVPPWVPAHRAPPPREGSSSLRRRRHPDQERTRPEAAQGRQ